ncbi:zinc-binding protein A33-like [Misgurnus anguillicaudatus]|uniref:zinc-binding protein A33-like n=1 Tax=Misgurnus anguillicaudatus TaxID=75329 RepID=UPI003CCF5756
MASVSFPEEDLICPVCCDFFTDPVVLDCSHSFCRSCMERFWSSQLIDKKTCPVCRTECFNKKLLSNLVLRNIVESVQASKQTSEKKTKREEAQATRHKSTQKAGKRDDLCSLHREKLFFFCKEDQELLCMVCQLSKRHEGHHISPVEEAAHELKDKVRLSLGKLSEEQMISIAKKDECLKTTQHIKDQNRLTKAQIKKDFEQLHHFLRLEETARISALEDEAEMKNNIMKKKLEEVSKTEKLISNTIQTKWADLEREDIQFLQAYKSYKDSDPPCNLHDPALGPDALIDVAKHLGNLKFNAWHNLLGQVQYYPIIMDPNTAAPWLKLSENLTSVYYTDLQAEIPDNPERCDLCVCVLGDAALDADTHWWEVEVGNKTKWDMGVMIESLSHKGILNVNSESGFWALALREGGQYSACTKPWTRLNLKRKPHRIRICLNNVKNELSFYDPLDMTNIYTFEHLPTRKLVPFFSPCVSDHSSNTEPLRILPLKVDVTITAETAH